MMEYYIAAVVVLVTAPLWCARKRIQALIQAFKNRSTEETQAIVADLGEKNKFYYCDKRKSWVYPGEEDKLDALLEAKSAPPPATIFMKPSGPSKPSLAAPAPPTARYVDPFAAMGLSKPRESSVVTPMPPPVISGPSGIPQSRKWEVDVTTSWDTVLATRDASAVSEGYKLATTALQERLDSLGFLQVLLGLLTSLVLLSPGELDQRTLDLATAAYQKHADDEDVVCSFCEILCNLHLDSSKLHLPRLDSSRPPKSDHQREWMRLVASFEQ